MFKSSENIIKIYDENGKIFDFKKIEIKNYISKYSNTKQNVNRIFIDDILLPRKSKFKIEYKCQVCKSIYKMAIRNLVRNVKSNRCKYCREQDLLKRKNHSINLKKSKGKKYSIKNKIKINPNYLQFKKYSIKSFENENDDFKKTYFNKHLTKFEFNLLLKNVIKINDKPFNRKNIEYLPHVIVHNQCKYGCKILYKNEKKIDILHNLYLICACCNEEFKITKLIKYRHMKKHLCKKCSFCNKTFKIKSIKNIENNSVLYQSKMELDFILFCNNNNLVIESGPSLNYFWNNKNRKYRVDFYLPKFNYLIEIKDNHIWHRNEVKSGKFEQKTNAAKKEVNNGVFKKYFIIFPNKVEWLKNYLLRYNLNL